MYPKPDARYGISKVFGEMLGSLYADKYGLEVFLIRIGYASSTPDDLHGLALWVSPRHLAQLVAIGIDTRMFTSRSSGSAMCRKMI